MHILARFNSGVEFPVRRDWDEIFHFVQDDKSYVLFP